MLSLTQTTNETSWARPNKARLFIKTLLNSNIFIKANSRQKKNIYDGSVFRLCLRLLGTKRPSSPVGLLFGSPTLARLTPFRHEPWSRSGKRGTSGKPRHTTSTKKNLRNYPTSLHQKERKGKKGVRRSF